MLKKTIFILVIPCLFFFLLGVWQLIRLNWKKGIIRSMSLPVTYLSGSNLDLNMFDCRNIEIDGILSDIELYIFAGRLGYHLLSPMLLNNGKYMLVNKGIVGKKNEKREKIKRIIATGVLYCDTSKSKGLLLVGKNNITLNTWITLNVKEISSELGIILERCVLWKKSPSSALFIQPARHLEYSITWFLLSLIWFVIAYRTINTKT